MAVSHVLGHVHLVHRVHRADGQLSAIGLGHSLALSNSQGLALSLNAHGADAARNGLGADGRGHDGALGLHRRANNGLLCKGHLCCCVL